jgi:hypothetical protein
MRRLRFTPVDFTTSALMCVIAASCGDPRADAEIRTAAAPAGIEFERIDVACSGDFSEGDPWELSLRSDGRATETVFVGEKSIVRSFDVPLDTVTRIRALLTENAFDLLPSELGRIVLSGSVRTIALTGSGGSKTVSMKHADDIAFPRRDDKETAKRFFRVWSTLEGCIESSDAHRHAGIDSAVLREWGLP